MEKLTLLPHQKLCLSIEETAAYSMLGENRLRKLIEEDRTLPWVLHVGAHTRVKRQQFERWLADQHDL